MEENKKSCRILIKRRLKSSSNNTMPVLASGELAFDESKGTLYIGSSMGVSLSSTDSSSEV